ncbi:hypothetical protein, partial [Citrobacter freundii]|uniref:hypothetical protein n=1 Tax=Citrobacter freundii TaxID=546 RepID=UPI0019540604
NERVQVYEFVFDEAGNLLELKPLLNQRSLLRLPRHGQPLPPAGTGLSGPPVRPDGGINVQ